MLTLYHKTFKIEIDNIPDYKINVTGDTIDYSFTHYDEEALTYQSCNHGVKIYENDKLYNSAIVCAVANSTTIHEDTAVIEDGNLLICCANKVFSLNIPNLKLNWLTQVDQSTCFGIYKTNGGVFTHGELEVSKIDERGNIIWQRGVRDIIVNISDERDAFKIHDNCIEIIDFDTRIYKLDFDGNFIY